MSNSLYKSELKMVIQLEDFNWGEGHCIRSEVIKFDDLDISWYVN